MFHNSACDFFAARSEGTSADKDRHHKVTLPPLKRVRPVLPSSKTFRQAAEKLSGSCIGISSILK
jgi:hypothetical protein